MARTPLTSLLRDPEPEAKPLDPVQVLLWDNEPRTEDGATVTELGGGGAIVDFNAYRPRERKAARFDSNLAEDMDETELASISSDLLQGIKADDDSRQEWLQTHAEGIELLGFKIESPKSGTSSAPLEGMSTARHPLLAEACVAFQANARGELLPAQGPVKVRDDRPQKPSNPMMGHNGGPPLDGGAAPAMPAPGMASQPPMPPQPPAPPALAQPSSIPGLPLPSPGQDEKSDRDLLAEALEKDFNHYLTTTAQEYYPDTDRMFFSVGFGGQGVKKVYNCPLRRRPVSEAITMEDFIVSNALTDLGNAARITHRIKMRPSVLKRMQLLGVYRDIDLGAPVMPQSNPITDAKASVVGVNPQPQDPKDNDYELYECYCELNLDQFAPRQFKGKGLALPYRVTIERTTQKVLEVRRNWREDDKECMAREYFVEFPYLKTFGFYGIGLLHLLGNLTKTLTAVWREFVDSGMFSNFPGAIVDKRLMRQLTNQFRVPPGGAIPVDAGLAPLKDAIMPLPYKDLGPGFAAFVQHVEELAQRLGGTANIGVGEGRQDAPVGTTLALIEQATKPIGAVLKRLHAAQSKEFQLLKDRFRDDPEAFWRFNKRPARPWQKEQLIQALEDFDLVPVSDPNNPTKLHRAAKSSALQQIAMAAPGLLNPQKVFKRIATNLDIDNPDELLAPPMAPQPPPVDPAKMAQATAKVQGDQIRTAAEVEKVRIQQTGDVAELQLRREIAIINQDTERLKLASSIAMHADKIDATREQVLMRILADHASREHANTLAIARQNAEGTQSPSGASPAPPATPLP